MVVDSNQHDRAVLTGGRGRPQPEELVEEDHRHEATAHADDIGSGEALDPRATIGPQRHQLADGGLRVWQQASTDPAWHERVFVPTMRPLLHRDVERVLTTHGDPVLHDGRKALEAALAAGPWDYRAAKD